MTSSLAGAKKKIAGRKNNRNLDLESATPDTHRLIEPETTMASKRAKSIDPTAKKLAKGSLPQISSGLALPHKETSSPYSKQFLTVSVDSFSQKKAPPSYKGGIEDLDRETDLLLERMRVQNASLHDEKSEIIDRLGEDSLGSGDISLINKLI